MTTFLMLKMTVSFIFGFFWTMNCQRLYPDWRGIAIGMGGSLLFGSVMGMI